MRTLYRRLFAVVSMFVGVAGVLYGVYHMNELNKPPAPEPKKAGSELQIDKLEKKPDPVKPKPRPQKKAPPAAAQRAPAPNISTALSGLSFDLPQFDSGGALGASELLGADTGDKKLVMTEDSVDSLPTPRVRVAPQYPSRAQQRGIQGHVLLKLRISERGAVEQVSVVEATPSGVFEDVAIAAVRQWTFEPARYGGEPVAISVSQRIPFRLN